MVAKAIGDESVYMRAAVILLLAVLSGALPSPAAAQSPELLRSLQHFEAAKTAGRVEEALKAGDEAVRLSDAGGDAGSLAELLRNLGDYALQSGKEHLALGYYQRSLQLQEAQLGNSHPDLVVLLTDMADLEIRQRHYPQAQELLQRILQIERAAYGNYHENVIATLAKIRDVCRANGDAAGAARAEAEMQPPPAASRGGLPVPGEVAKNRRYKSSHGYATVRVFYGTNRATSGDLKPAAYYGRARGELQYGHLDVTIPESHERADLETQPRWIDYTFSASPAEMRTHYVLLDKITPLPKDDFVRALREQINGAPSKDVFIFVHGFNNSFEDAARRVAQLAYDLDFDGTPMLYSWPSQGSATDYTIDEAAVGISGRKMAEFMETVVAQSGAQHIHLIAHSMGNRALIEALQTFLAKRAPENRQHLFGQIVFTAPDVDRDYFMDAVESLRPSADRTTLYASNNDYALRSSQFVHGAPRAGTAGDVMIKLAGLDSIDMSGVPADSLGHSYFAANAGAIFDIFRLLWRGDPPSSRCGMSAPKSSDAIPVWIFNAEVCKGDDMLEAGMLLKRFGNLARDRVVANISALTDPSQKQHWSDILKRLDGLLSNTK